MDKKDYCTGWWDRYLGVDISDCCKLHDETLGTHVFFRCLKAKIGWFHATYITAGGAVGAWIRYTKTMISKI